MLKGLHSRKDFFRKPIFSCYQRIKCIKIILWTLICPLSIWQLGLKLESADQEKAL